VTTTLDDQAFTVIADMTDLGRQSVVVKNANLLLLANEVTQGFPMIYGVVDVAGDGHAVIFAETDHGASTAFFTMIRLVNHRLTQMTLEDEPVELTVNGSVKQYSIVGCGTGELVWAAFAWNDVDRTYDAERIEYRLDRAELEQVRRTTHRFVADSEERIDPTELSTEGYDVRCPPLIG
jgi:hypothetical protein